MIDRDVNVKKRFIEEEELLEEGFRLAVEIFDSGFRPDFIVGIGGGSTVGIYVQECLQYLGVKTDHIAIRTSYRGQPSYGELIDNPERIRVHGLQYLFENLDREDKLLIVDDVLSSATTSKLWCNDLSANVSGTCPRRCALPCPTTSRIKIRVVERPIISCTPLTTGWYCPTSYKDSLARRSANTSPRSAS